MDKDDFIIPDFPPEDLLKPADFYNNPSDSTKNPSDSTNDKKTQLDLRKIYDEEKKPQDNTKEFEEQCLQHLGPLAYPSVDVSYLYVYTGEISCQTNTEELFLQAASLVEPSVWREDGYILNILNKGARPNILTTGDFGRLHHFEDKDNVECFVEYGQQRFVHQYSWHDQSLHLYTNIYTSFTKVVPKRKRIFGNYNDILNELVNKGQAPLSRLQEIADGSQKYIRLRYTHPSDGTFQKLDDHAFYLFSDGHVYSNGLSFETSDFKRALTDNVERTMRFIVKQIIALNEQNKWNINDVSGYDFRL